MKALIIATFGTTHTDAVKRDLFPVLRRIHREHSDLRMMLAYTSRMVIRRIKERDDVHLHTEREAFDALREAGFSADAIYIQPLHIIPGSEYDKLKDLEAEGAHLGEPLFAGPEDLERFLDHAEKEALPTIYVGHGSRHAADSVYEKLDEAMKSRGLSMGVATLEGALEGEPVFERFKECGYGEVALKPLLLLAGDHAKNDIAGDEASYRVTMERMGFKVHTTATGLGSVPFIQGMYAEKCDRLLRGEARG